MYQLFLERRDGTKCPCYVTDSFEKMQIVAKEFSVFFVVLVGEVDEPLFDIQEEKENENK